MKFEPKSVVWAITIGEPIWPAYVEKQLKGQYKVKFFAESCTATISQYDMFDYLQNKQKYKGSTNSKKLLKAMELAQKFIEDKKKANQKNQANNKSHSKSKNKYKQSKIQQKKNEKSNYLIKQQFSSSEEYYKEELKNKQTSQTKLPSNSTIVTPVQPQQPPQIIMKKEIPCNKIYHFRNLEEIILPNFLPKIEQIKQESLEKKNNKMKNQKTMISKRAEMPVQNFVIQKENIRASNRQIQSKFEETMSILYLQQKNDPTGSNYYIQIKQAITKAIKTYGDGINIYGYFFTRIANLIHFIFIKLRELNSSYFQSEVQFLEKQYKRIENIFIDHLSGIEEYKSYEKYHTPIKHQQEQTITRPEAVCILLDHLKSFYKQKIPQETLKKSALKIEEKIFESDEDYTKLVKLIQSKFQNKSQELLGLNLDDLIQELSNLMW